MLYSFPREVWLMHGLFERLRAPLAAALLSPLLALGVVIAGPVGAASALVRHSGAVGLNWDLENWKETIPDYDVKCDATLFYRINGTATTGTQELGVKGGNCDTGMWQNISGMQLTIVATGVDGLGSECMFSAVTHINEDDQETFGPLFMSNTPLGGSPVPVTPGTDCVITEVCLDLDTDGIAAGSHWTDCAAALMGEPIWPGESVEASRCEIGGLKSVSSTAAFKTDPDHAYVDVTLEWTDNTPVGANWRVVWILTPPGSMAPYTGNHIRSTIAVPANRITTKRIQVASYPVPASPSDWTQFVGAMTYPYFSPWGGNTGYTTEFNELYLPAQGLLGTSDASKCRFYFGPKIAEVPDSTIDEPAGSVNGAPVVPVDDVEPEPINEPDPIEPDPSTCTFNVTDPSTWLEGGMCAAVGLLGSILGLLAQMADLILGIPAAIMDLLGGKLTDLFVPSDGYLDAKTTATRDALDATSPGKYWDAFSGLTPGEVSGCAGIEVSPPGPDGAPMFTERLGAACAGKMADVAQLCRLALSAVVVIGGGLGCVRALGSGLNWSPGVGRDV